MNIIDDRHCDWHGKCKRKPYADVFPLRDKPLEKRELPCDEWYFDSWSYLCYWHLQYERFVYFIKRHVLRQKVALGWGLAETTEEYLKRLDEEERDAEMAAEYDRAVAEKEAEDRARIEFDAARAEECGYYQGD